MLHALDIERWPDIPSQEGWATPPASRPRGAVVNRWGDTAADQRRRREALCDAMREVDDGPT